MASGQFDLPKDERRVLEERAKHRAILRQEYIKQITNPHRHGSGEGGVLFDTGVQRFMSMRATLYDNFKPTAKSGGYAFGLVILPIVLYGWWIKSSRDARENLYRTGQVAYKDRRFKFQ